jgi:hypothetical protein
MISGASTAARTLHSLRAQINKKFVSNSFQVDTPVDDPMVQDVSLSRRADQHTGPIPVLPYSICTVPSSSPVATIGERPFRRSVRNVVALAADIRRKPMACEEDGPTASATMWTVMLARAMAGCSGMTWNVRTMPPPLISIGVYLGRMEEFGG